LQLWIPGAFLNKEIIVTDFHFHLGFLVHKDCPLLMISIFGNQNSILIVVLKIDIIVVASLDLREVVFMD